MSTTLPFKRIGDHLFAEVERELLLVDTGTAESFSEGGTRTIAPDMRIVNDRSPFVAVDEMWQRFGVPMVGIIGMDLLGRCDVVFDLPAGALTLSPTPLPRPPGAHELRSRMGLPVIELLHEDGMHTGKTDITVFLDSGARYSYFSPDRIAATEIGQIDDYSPVLGTLKATLYRSWHRPRVGAARFRVPMKFAAPPIALATLLGMAGVEGVLGAEAFYQTVMMSMRESWVARA